MYRRLAKRAHPDLLHDDGSTFLYLQYRFDRFIDEWTRDRSLQRLAVGIDPHRIIREIGITGEIPVRTALYVSLYRYRALGLTSRKVRVRPAMRRRNEEVFRTVAYWAYRYDRQLVPILERFLHGSDFPFAERRTAHFFLVRRTILRAFDSFLRYQDRGRPVSREIAEERLRYAHALCEGWKNDPAFSSLHAMAGWLLREAKLDPQLIGLDL